MRTRSPRALRLSAGWCWVIRSSRGRPISGHNSRGVPKKELPRASPGWMSFPLAVRLLHLQLRGLPSAIEGRRRAAIRRYCLPSRDTEHLLRDPSLGAQRARLEGRTAPANLLAGLVVDCCCSIAHLWLTTAPAAPRRRRLLRSRELRVAAAPTSMTRETTRTKQASNRALSTIPAHLLEPKRSLDACLPLASSSHGQSDIPSCTPEMVRAMNHVTPALTSSNVDGDNRTTVDRQRRR